LSRDTPTQVWKILQVRIHQTLDEITRVLEPKILLHYSPVGVLDCSDAVPNVL
jgi:hypothetical protein